jgi:hypothetical protein
MDDAVVFSGAVAALIIERRYRARGRLDGGRE